MLNSGMMVYSSSSSQFWGKDLNSVFVPKSVIMNRIMDVDYVDIDKTVIEEISDYMESESGQFLVYFL